MSPAEALRSLALGQATMVLPALGEDYAGRTAGTIAGLLLMLAADLETAAAREAAARARLRALLAAAPEGSLPPALTRSRDDADADVATLLEAFLKMHRWADAHDAALAARCRAFLVEWTAGQRLAPPVVPS